MLRDSLRQEDPINRGLQRTLGPWHQDPTACAEAGRQQSTTKATFKTPEWTEEEGLGSGDPCAERWEMPFLILGQPTDPAVQPLQGVLTSLVLAMGTALVTGMDSLLPTAQRGPRGSCLF